MYQFIQLLMRLPLRDFAKANVAADEGKNQNETSALNKEMKF